eukprot:5216485-Pyramimonas_sp.AAC.1
MEKHGRMDIAPSAAPEFQRQDRPNVIHCKHLTGSRSTGRHATRGPNKGLPVCIARGASASSSP